jgi:chromosome segregation ATPase
MTREISNNEDVLDSRDIIERIEELESEKESELESLNEAKEEADQAVSDLEDKIREIEGQLEQLEPEDEHRESLESRLEDLQEDLDEACDNQNDAYKDVKNFVFDDEEELSSLQSLAEEAEGYSSDWAHGEALIRYDYFEDYCKQMLEDCGDLPKNLPSYIEIDWAATAKNLEADYTEVDFDGVSYFMRCS